MTTTVSRIAGFLEHVAPAGLAETWDNIGLLVGDPTVVVRKIMTCLTATPQSVREAIEQDADLVVTHHPLPFRPLERLTTDTTGGRMLLDLASARIAVHSSHTAFDSAPNGINQQLAVGLGLDDTAPLVPNEDGSGSGRMGRFRVPITLGQWAERVKAFLAIDRLQVVGDPDLAVSTASVACGAADEFLDAACTAGCQAILIGETRFHTALEAEARGVGLVVPGHFASERFAMEYLAEVLAAEFPDVDVWACRSERDPYRCV